MSINWRLASRLSVITLALLVVVLVVIIQQNRGLGQLSTPGANASGLPGADLGKTPAPDFRLTDQFGKAVTLSDFKGKPVIVTFLYTHCPDVCPLTAEKLRATMQILGKDAQNVGILAVSTDPKGDTQQAVLDFSKAHNLQDNWHYLIGSREQLSPIWTGYNIQAKSIIGSKEVDHSRGVYLIDKQGLERTFMDNDLEPAQLAEALRTLMRE